MKYAFEVLGAGPKFFQLLQLVADQTAESQGQSSFLSVPFSAMDAGRTYTFLVTVSNFLGLSQSAVHNVTKSDRDLPRVSVVGAAQRTARRAEDLVLAGRVALTDLGPAAYIYDRASATCILATTTTVRQLATTVDLDFRWLVVVPGGERASLAALPELKYGTPGGLVGGGAGLVGAYLASTRSPTLVIPKHLLTPGVLYTFVLRATKTLAQSEDSNPPVPYDLTNEAEVQVAVIGSPVHVTIRGGSRQVASTDRVALEAFAVDPDMLTSCDGAIMPFSYAWTIASQDSGHGADGTLSLSLNVQCSLNVS